MGHGGQTKKKTWKFSRAATLGFCQAEQVDGSDECCFIEPGQPGLVNQGGLIKQKRDHGPVAQVVKVGLSEPTPMTTLVPFWMEGNSSTDFGLVTTCNRFILGGFKKNPLF